MFGEHLAGIYEKAMNPGKSLQEKLETAKQLGFDYMELCIDESDEYISRLDWNWEEIDRLRNISFDLNIPIMSMCLSAHRRFPFGSSDETVRLKARQIMEKAIDLAFNLGIRTIQLAGYDVYYEESSAHSELLFKEAIAWAAGRAARKGIMLGMETMDTCFLNSVKKYKIYENKICSPWFRLYPDLGNLTAWNNGSTADELQLGMSSIVAVHLKDTIAPTENKEGQFRNVLFGEGCVDFMSRFIQLEENGYKGPYLIETWYKSGTEDTETIQRAAEYLKRQYDDAMICRK